MSFKSFKFWFKLSIRTVLWAKKWSKSDIQLNWYKGIHYFCSTKINQTIIYELFDRTMEYIKLTTEFTPQCIGFFSLYYVYCVHSICWYECYVRYMLKHKDRWMYVMGKYLLLYFSTILLFMSWKFFFVAVVIIVLACFYRFFFLILRCLSFSCCVQLVQYTDAENVL